MAAASQVARARASVQGTLAKGGEQAITHEMMSTLTERKVKLLTVNELLRFSRLSRS